MFIANPSRRIASRRPSRWGLPSANEDRRQGQSGGLGGLAVLGEDRRHLRVGGGLVDGRAGDPGHGPNDRNRGSGWAVGPCVRRSEVAADGGGFPPFPRVGYLAAP